MSVDAVKLTIYLGETDRHRGGLVADHLQELYAEHNVHASVLLRGVEGFGYGHRVHTDRLESRSLDPPLVSVAVDRRERIEPLLPLAAAMLPNGLLTLERARLVDGALLAAEDDVDEAKLTVYCGRAERVHGRPAYRAVVDCLLRHGVAGATVLLGVDGLLHGVRRRARFFAANRDVPLMIVAVGSAQAVRAAAGELAAMLAEPLMTHERVRVCKRDGVALQAPDDFSGADSGGLPLWQKLMVYSRPRAHVHGRPLSEELVRRLRDDGAAGATTLRGVWGYSGDHPPHGDRLLAVRRNTPLLTVVIDEPARIQQWWSRIDELTPEAGLVTSEIVPSFRASARDGREGVPELRAPRLPPR